MPAQNQPQPLPNGTLLGKGRFTIEDHLGGGGFGHVYLARDARQQVFAIKQCTDLSAEAVAQFGHEIAVLKMLASQSAMYPKVYEQFEQTFPGVGGAPNVTYIFAVMEFVPGRTLESLVDERIQHNRGPFTEQEVLVWTTQLLEALEYTHRNKGIVHRDIKPGNIMLAPDGKQIKIIDVGIAKIGGVGTKTEAGARAASAGFAPPEQYAQAGQTGPVSDIYAVGATMYILLTLITPVEAPARMSGQALIPPRQINPQISQQTESAVLRALELTVNSRYQTAAEMLAALQGKAQQSLPTRRCPNCGHANQLNARFCSNCRFVLQGLIFQQAGIQVQSVTELPDACDRAWGEAIGYLATGKFDQWLQSAGAVGQAWVSALQSVRGQFPTNPNLQLDAFLRMVDPQRPLPQLHVQPTQTTPTTVEQGVAHNVPITITNTGGGMLQASLSAAEPWITFQPNSVQLLTGKSQIVAARLDTTPLTGNRNGSLYTGQVNIQGNGGSHTLTLQLQVTAAPRLTVQQLQVDFGEVRHGQTPVSSVQIANTGVGALQIRIQSSVAWLQTAPAQTAVQTRASQSVAIQAATRQIGQRGLHSGELYIDAGQDGSATVKATIKLSGPLSLSCDSTASITTIQELVNWCDAHWGDAVQLLRSGELFAAVSYLGEPTKGLFRRRGEPWPVTLGKVQQAATSRNFNLALENALRALGAEPSIYTHNWRTIERQLGLGLIPDVRWMIPWWRGPQQVEFRIKNAGRGYLHGRLNPLVSWLVIDQRDQEFNCMPGHEARVPIRVSKQRRRLKGWKPALLELYVN